MAKKTDELAIISIICGGLSFVFIPLLPAIAAIIMGFISRGRIRQNPQSLQGEGLALLGIVLGLANVVLIVGFFLIIALLAWSSSAFLPTL